MASSVCLAHPILSIESRNGRSAQLSNLLRPKPIARARVLLVFGGTPHQPREQATHSAGCANTTRPDLAAAVGSLLLCGSFPAPRECAGCPARDANVGGIGCHLRGAADRFR